MDSHREKSRPGSDTEGTRIDPAIPKSSARPRKSLFFTSQPGHQWLRWMLISFVCAAGGLSSTLHPSQQASPL